MPLRHYGSSAWHRVARSAPQTDALAFVKDHAVKFVKEHKTISTSYLLGIILLLFGTGFVVTDTQAARYNEIMDSIDIESNQKAWQDLYIAKERYNARAGWFGSCNQHCMPYKQRMEAAQAIYDEAKRREEAITSAAKSEVGIMSQFGVQETRDMFWGVFAGGKEFAKRQSWWDLIFSGLRWGRDEQLFSVILRWLIQLLFNFTRYDRSIGCLRVEAWGLVQPTRPGYWLHLLRTRHTCRYGLRRELPSFSARSCGQCCCCIQSNRDYNHRLKMIPPTGSSSSVAAAVPAARRGMPGGGRFRPTFPAATPAIPLRLTGVAHSPTIIMIMQNQSFRNAPEAAAGSGSVCSSGGYRVQVEGPERSERTEQMWISATTGGLLPE